MNQKILGYEIPDWQKYLFIGEAVVGAGFITWGAFVIWNTLRVKPEAEAPKQDEVAGE